MDTLIQANPPQFTADQTLHFTCNVGISAPQMEAMRAHYRSAGLCDEHVEHFHVLDLLRIALSTAGAQLEFIMDSDTALPDLGSPIHMDGHHANDSGLPAGTPAFRISVQLPAGFHRAQ